MAGGLTAAVDVAAGDVVAATIDRLGSVELACREMRVPLELVAERLVRLAERQLGR